MYLWNQTLTPLSPRTVLRGAFLHVHGIVSAEIIVEKGPDMVGQTRALTLADLNKIQAFHRGELQLPSWITAWNQKIEEATSNLAAAIAQEALTPELRDHYTRAVVKMMRRRDALYDWWLSDLPFKSWEDLANERPPSHEDLFKHAVLDTEDFLNGPGIPAFVFFLNERWPGFFKDFAHTLLRECDPLLEEVLELTTEIRHTLSYPAETFGTKNKEIFESRMLEWAETILPRGAPNYAQRLLRANIMVALGREMGACSEMEFARCEAVEPQFPSLMRMSDPQTNKLLEQTQHWQIDVLLKLWPGC